MSSGTAGVEGAVFEPPFPIPESWVWTKLGEIGDTNIGLTYHPQDISDNGIPVLRSNNIQNGNLVLSSLVRVACHILPSQFIKNGDVLICARNGSKALVGKSVLVDSLVEPTSFGAFMAVFRSQFNPFIQLFLQSDEFKQYLNKSNSTTIHQLTQSMLKDAWMPFPPFSEQQRIVKRFDALSALCDAIDIQSVSLSVLAEQAKQKVLDLAIRGLLVSQNPTDEPASTLLDCIRSTADKPPCPKLPANPPFPIPQNWAWTTLGTVCDYGKCETVDASTVKDSTWSLDLEDIEKGTGRLLVRVRAGERSAAGARHSFRAGELLYSKLRTYLNKVLVADEDGICSSEILPLDFRGQVLPEYARCVLMSPLFLDYAARCGYGVKMPRLGTADGRNGPFPLPPLAEQRRIVAKVDEMFATIDGMLG